MYKGYPPKKSTPFLKPSFPWVVLADDITLEVEFLTDESLMTKLKNGQLDASGLLYQRYKKRVWSYFYHGTNDQARSDDLLQFTFEKVIKNRQQYSGRGSFSGWLFTIARNVLRDEWKKKDRSRTDTMDELPFSLEAENPSGETELMLDDRRVFLRQALSSLSPEKRSLLAMVKLREKRYQEVADAHGMNVSTLKVQIFRIMQELKAYAQNTQAKRQL